MKRALKMIGTFLAVILMAVVVFFAVLTVKEYNPPEREDLLAEGEGDRTFAPGDTLTLLTWNIGYGALGDNADFFMDGGKGVRTADRARVQENVAGIASQLLVLNPDIIFLQEVDFASDRSYKMDQAAYFASTFPEDSAVTATNYQVLFVPYPIPPIGAVNSGLQTLSRAGISAAERIQLPCPFSWPVRLGNLKRCLLVTRIPLAGTEKELVAVNLHLEAYDSGEGKVAQTAMLTDFLRAEADKGNYVIAGGDFNQIFTSIENPWPVYENKWLPGEIDTASLGEGFTPLMDARVPTCRSLDQPLLGADQSKFQFYVIDGFIVSDNVRVESLETLDRRFVNTDHNPVKLVVTLGN